jgi:hypothetical protein
VPTSAGYPRGEEIEMVSNEPQSVTYRHPILKMAMVGNGQGSAYTPDLVGFLPLPPLDVIRNEGAGGFSVLVDGSYTFSITGNFTDDNGNNASQGQMMLRGGYTRPEPYLLQKVPTTTGSARLEATLFSGEIYSLQVLDESPCKYLLKCADLSMTVSVIPFADNVPMTIYDAPCLVSPSHSVVVVMDTWAHHANGVLDHRARPVLARIRRFLDTFRAKGATVVFVPTESRHQTEREASAWTRSRSVAMANEKPITKSPGSYFTRAELGLEEFNNGPPDYSLHPDLELHPLDYLLDSDEEERQRLHTLSVGKRLFYVGFHADACIYSTRALSATKMTNRRSATILLDLTDYVGTADPRTSDAATAKGVYNARGVWRYLKQVYERENYVSHGSWTDGPWR